MRIRAAFAATALLTAGCYTNAAVPPAKLRKLSQPAAAPVEVGPSAFDGVRLGPRTSVRARRGDGTVSPWFTASGLATSRRGLLTGRSLGLGQMEVAVVRGLGPEGPALVSFLSPPGGRMWTEHDQMTLQAQRPGELARWAAAIASGSLAAGGPAGVWTFYHSKNGWIAENLGGVTLASVPLTSIGRLRIMEGIPWSDVAELEVHNFDPLASVAAAAGSALIIAMIIASVRANADPGPLLDLGGRAAFAASERAQEHEGPAATDGEDPRHEGFLVDPAGADATLTASPLFTASARRRDTAKLLLSVDSGWDGGTGVSSGFGVGVRLFDFWELGARVRGLHLGTGNVEDGITARAPVRLLAGGRLGVHIDGDGQPLSALTLGLELLTGKADDTRSLTAVTLSIGPRFGLGRKTFASLLFSPTYVSVDDPDNAITIDGVTPGYASASEWRFMFGAEVGLAL